jgi:hypothetical protein
MNKNSLIKKFDEVGATASKALSIIHRDLSKAHIKALEDLILTKKREFITSIQLLEAKARIEWENAMKYMETEVANAVAKLTPPPTPSPASAVAPITPLPIQTPSAPTMPQNDGVGGTAGGTVDIIRGDQQIGSLGSTTGVGASATPVVLHDGDGKPFTIHQD